MSEFPDLDAVEAGLSAQDYVCDRRVATVVHVAERLGKPILAEGPAGVGKTELAKVLAAALGRRLIRLQCYEGLDEAKSLYEWEYAKQLLYTQILREKVGELIGPAATLTEAAARLRQHDDVFFSESFLIERPILAAVRSAEPVVLLIDEIDRADEEFEAFLLEFLSEFQVSIPELGTVAAVHRPLVLLTSNRTRELSEALKRRCLHLLLDHPTPEAELEIVRRKGPALPDELSSRIVDVVQRLRGMDLRKAPSIGETLDWAQTLVVLGAPRVTREVLNETLSILVKYDRDSDRVRDALAAGELDSLVG